LRRSTLPLPATLPLDWEAGAHTVLDVRTGPEGTVPARVTPQVADNRIALQAGDPAETVGVGGASDLVAVVADARIATAAVVDGALRITPLTSGQTTVALTSASDPWAGANLAVVVGPRFAEPTGAPASAGLDPARGARGVPPDTLLRLMLAPGAQLTGEGSIRIWRKRDGALVGVIRPGETVSRIGPAPRQRLVREHRLQLVDGQLRAQLPHGLDYDTEYVATAEARLVRAGEIRAARWATA
jgi:hypothetical protein